MVAAQNGIFEIEVSIERDEAKIQLFELWAYYNNFHIKDITMPQHHDKIYQLDWYPYIVVDVGGKDFE